MQDNSPTHEIRINIHLNRQLAVVLIVTMLMIAAIAWFLWDSSPAEASSPDALAAESSVVGNRRYYLTAIDFWNGDEADTVCEVGFHFASLWELLDTSNLDYYFGSDSAYMTDSGSGPPATREGWVRTGYGNNTGTTPGQANCDGWTSPNETDYGTTALLPGAWSDPAFQVIHTWDVRVEPCDSGSNVWCIED